MKWSILGLFSLGLIAAVCAAMLVTSVNAGGASPRQGIVRAAPDVPQTTEATILVAARNFEALDVIDASGLATKTVPQEEVPIGAVAYDAEAIGKVLLRPVEEGEVIVSSLFAGEGSGVHVASALRKGKRAVSVTLTDNMGLEGLLYPGSVVDVLASMAVRDEPGGDERPVSMTLLQGVSVLAVGEQTIVSEGQRSEDSGAPLRQTRRPSVTLLVDAKQAEVLKLAMQEGSVSLVLRNPADDDQVEAEGTPMYALSPILETPREKRQVVVMKGGEAETKTFQVPGR